MKRTKLSSDPAEQLRAMIAATCKPGVSMLVYAHDTWCPQSDQGKGECCCEPDVYLVEEIPPAREKAVQS